MFKEPATINNPSRCSLQLYFHIKYARGYPLDRVLPTADKLAKRVYFS